jgi:predicted site-specific integrase-resolvase
MKLFLNASEVARLLKLNRATITRWAQKGAFKGAIRQRGKKEWHIPISAYEEFIKTQNNESR